MADGPPGGRARRWSSVLDFTHRRCPNPRGGSYSAPSPRGLAASVVNVWAPAALNLERAGPQVVAVRPIGSVATMDVSCSDVILCDSPFTCADRSSAASAVDRVASTTARRPDAPPLRCTHLRRAPADRVHLVLRRPWLTMERTRRAGHDGEALLLQFHIARTHRGVGSSCRRRAPEHRAHPLRRTTKVAHDHGRHRRAARRIGPGARRPTRGR